MLLPIIGFSLASLTLLKLGSLIVWVAVLALALKLALLTIVALTAMLGYSYFKVSGLLTASLALPTQM